MVIALPCYDDGRPIEHYKGLFWPQPYEVLLFAPTALDHGVTEYEGAGVTKPGHGYRSETSKREAGNFNGYFGRLAVATRPIIRGKRQLPVAPYILAMVLSPQPMRRPRTNRIRGRYQSETASTQAKSREGRPALHPQKGDLCPSPARTGLGDRHELGRRGTRTCLITAIVACGVLAASP